MYAAKIFTIVSLALSGALATVCNPKDYSRSAYTADLVQEANYFPNNTGVPLSISGSIRIVDGCTFVVDNFVFLPGFVDTLWYARSGNDTTHAMILSQTLVETSQYSTPTFNLTITPGAAISFYDFDTIVLFSRAANFEMAYATFNFSEDLQQWNRNATRPISTNSTTNNSTATDSTGQSSGATKLMPGMTTWGLLMIGTFVVGMLL